MARRMKMNTNWKKTTAQAALLLSLIAFAFWFALKDDYNQVLKNLSHVSIGWLLLILFSGVLYYLLQGYMLYIITKPYKEDISLKDGCFNAYIAAFFNGVTPLGGGQVSQTYAFRKLAIPYQDIASILWKEFFLYQIVVVGYACILIFTHISFSIEHFSAYFLLVMIGLLINASVILILWTMSHFPKLYTKISSIVVNLAHRLHIVKKKEETLEKWNTQVRYFSKEINKLKQDKKLITKGILINACRQTIYYSIPYLVGIGLGLPLKPEDIMTVLVLSCFIHMLNALTPLPGDSGWTESAFILIFGVLFGNINASSIMILWRTATYYLNILIGGIVFLVFKSQDRTPEHTK